MKPAVAEPLPLRILSKFEITLACTFLVLVFLGVLGQVVGRYLPVMNWAGWGEIARYSVVSLTFICVGYLIGTNGHITIQVIDYLAKGRAFVIVKIISATATALICGLLAYEAWTLIPQNMFRGTTVTQIPIGFFYVIPFIGFASGTIRSVYRIFIAGHEEAALEPEGVN